MSIIYYCCSGKMMKSDIIQEVLRAMPLPAVMLSAKAPDFAIEEVTDLWVNLTRIERITSVGNSFQVIFSPDVMSTFEALRHSFEDVIRHKRPERFPYVPYPVSHDPNNGEERFFKVTGENIPVLDSSGDVVFIIHTVRDVKGGATEICKEGVNGHSDVDFDLRIQALVDHADEPVILCDHDGRLLQVNGATTNLLGYEQEDFTKKITVWDIIERRGASNNFRWSNFQKEGYVSGYVDLKKRNGDVIHCNYNAWTHILSGKHLTILTDITETRKLEETLSKKERQFEVEQQRFYDMFREAPVGMCILKGPDHIYEKTNAFHDKLIGYRVVIGKTVEECFPELKEQGFIELLNDVYRTGETYVGQEQKICFQGQKEGGRDVYLNFMYQPFRNHHGEVAGIFYFGVDVTEQVLARKKIEASERRYRQIVETAQEGIWLVDKDLRTLFANHKMHEILGYSPEEMAEKSMLEYVDAADASSLQKILQAEADSLFFSLQIGFMSKQGIRVWAVLNITRNLTETGADNGLLAMVTDITARKKAEEELQRLSFIARSTTNAIIITNGDRKIQWVNDAFTRMTEYTLEEVVGQTTSFLYGPESNPERQRLIAERTGRQEPFVCQIVKYKKSGRPFWVEVEGRPVFDENAKLNYYFNTETDITDRQKAYEKLINAESQARNFARQLNQMLEDERSKIAREIHDEFGQQLMGFKMSLSSLGRLDALPGKARLIISELLDGVESTFHSLRNFSNDLRPGILDTLGLIPSIEWLVRGFEKRSRIPCSLEMKVNKQKFGRDLSINFFRICQEALTNIVKHAEATAVSVEMVEQGEDLFMKISDNGKGMVTEKLENAFSLGFLGMHERARLIGGDLDIYSQVGKGTMIKVTAKVQE